MKKEEHSLLYHAMHSRPMAGCLPLFFLLAAIVIGCAFFFVEVHMPEPTRPQGNGKIMHINDEITAMRMKLRSPLPLILPAYVDPTRIEAAADQTLPRKATPELQPSPGTRIFERYPDSLILDEKHLLQLPPPSQPQPVEAGAAPSATPEQGDREEPAAV